VRYGGPYFRLRKGSQRGGEVGGSVGTDLLLNEQVVATFRKGSRTLTTHLPGHVGRGKEAKKERTLIVSRGQIRGKGGHISSGKWII